jgi:hypothetical protein
MTSSNEEGDGVVGTGFPGLRSIEVVGTVTVSEVAVVSFHVRSTSRWTSYDVKVSPAGVLKAEPGGDVMLPVHPELQVKKVSPIPVGPPVNTVILRVQPVTVAFAGGVMVKSQRTGRVAELKVPEPVPVQSKKRQDPIVPIYGLPGFGSIPVPLRLTPWLLFITTPVSEPVGLPGILQSSVDIVPVGGPKVGTAYTSVAASIAIGATRQALRCWLGLENDRVCSKWFTVLLEFGWAPTGISIFGSPRRAQYIPKRKLILIQRGDTLYAVVFKRLLR